MFAFFLGLLPDFLKVWLGVKQDTAERLGKAEQKSDDLQASLAIANAEAKAAADAPQDKEALIIALKDHRICVLLALFLLTSCAHGNACPQIRQWSPKDQDEIAANLSMLPPDSPLVAVGVEWSHLRAQARACQNGG